MYVYCPLRPDMITEWGFWQREAAIRELRGATEDENSGPTISEDLRFEDLQPPPPWDKEELEQQAEEER